MMLFVILSFGMISTAAEDPGVSKTLGGQIRVNQQSETVWPKPFYRDLQCSDENAERFLRESDRLERDDTPLFSSDLGNETYSVSSLAWGGSLYRDRVRYRSWKQTRVRWRKGEGSEIFRPGPSQWR